MRHNEVVEQEYKTFKEIKKKIIIQITIKFKLTFIIILCIIYFYFLKRLNVRQFDTVIHVQFVI